MLTPPLQEFVQTVDQLMSRELAQPALLAALTPEFQRVLAERQPAGPGALLSAGGLHRAAHALR